MAKLFQKRLNMADTCDDCFYLRRILVDATRRLGPVGLDKVNVCEECKNDVPKEPREFAKYFIGLRTSNELVTEDEIDEYLKFKGK